MNTNFFSKIRACFIIVCTVFFFSSCNLFDPAEPIPAYLHIDKISVNAASGQGSGASKIVDAWIYVDDELIGVFELPATVPVLKEGSKTIKIRAGIKQNGMTANRVAYPFYNFYSTTKTLQPGVVTTLEPVVNYFSLTNFPWMENFESTGFNFSRGTDSDTTLMTTENTSEVFEGTKSGVAYLDGNKDFFEAKSSISFTLPKAGSEVFVELNYKSNNSFAVGLYGNNSGAPMVALFLKPSAEWNKIYIDLKPLVNTSSSTTFTAFIGMSKDADIAAPVLFIDNVKVVY